MPSCWSVGLPASTLACVVGLCCCVLYVRAHTHPYFLAHKKLCPSPRWAPWAPNGLWEDTMQKAGSGGELAAAGTVCAPPHGLGASVQALLGVGVLLCGWRTDGRASFSLLGPGPQGPLGALVLWLDPAPCVCPPTQLSPSQTPRPGLYEDHLATSEGHCTRCSLIWP